jgi:sodium/proline symporter
MGVLMSVVAISFSVFILIFLGIGVYSATRKQDTDEDFLIASRSIGPWMMALSAVATNNSGFMFVGLIGSTYIEGVSGIVLIGGWVLGDYVAWLVGIPKALRARSEEMGVATIPSFLGWGIPGGRIVVIIAGFIVLVFLGTYAAAQLTAGSKALHALFGWDTTIGAVVGAVIVVIYCFSGGIRASIWTDVAQSIVMFFAMIMLFIVGLNEVGGPSALWVQLEAIDPQLISFTPASAPFGLVMFAVGWLVAGFGVVGQPHIMVRAMTLDSPQNMPVARRVYFTWNIVFACGAIGVGLVSRVLLTETTGFDPELAMPTLSIELLPPILVGLVLAGLFAATMSTADSQVLSCSAAITQDIAPRPNGSHNYTRFGTIAVTAIMLAIALSGGSVFGLVTLAWSVLASTLGPLLVAQSLGRPPRAGTAVAMMLGAFAAVLGWKYGLGYGPGLYEALPGMLAGTLIYFVGNAVTGKLAEHE